MAAATFVVGYARISVRRPMRNAFRRMEAVSPSPITFSLSFSLLDDHCQQAAILPSHGSIFQPDDPPYHRVVLKSPHLGAMFRVKKIKLCIVKHRGGLLAIGPHWVFAQLGICHASRGRLGRVALRSRSELRPLSSGSGGPDAGARILFLRCTDAQAIIGANLTSFKCSLSQSITSEVRKLPSQLAYMQARASSHVLSQAMSPHLNPVCA